MIDGKFDVVFRGQIVKSFELETVKSNLIKLFKSSPQAVEKLFSGGEVTIRRGLDYASAMKYQSALKNAGALALIKEVEESSTETAPNKQPETQKVSPQTAAPVEARESSTQENSQSSEDSAKAENEQSMSIAAAGAQILPPKVYEQREVDTSELSLAAAGERILPESEPEQHAQPSIDHLSLE